MKFEHISKNGAKRKLKIRREINKLLQEIRWNQIKFEQVCNEDNADKDDDSQWEVSTTEYLN